MKNIKILLVAQNASSRFGGEAFLPLKYFQILKARGHFVNLITHSRNREGLSEHFKSDFEFIHFIKDSFLHRAIWTMSKPFPRAIQDAIFGTALNFIDEMHQSRMIRKLIRENKVDIIHQPIPVSPKALSSIYGFDMPVVIGPMNGGMHYPPGYEKYQSNHERKFVKAARQIAWLLNWIVPGKRRATTLLVANNRTKEALPVGNHPRVIELVENAVDLTTWNTPHPRNQTATFKIVFMGRLVHWKAVDITIEAIKLAAERGIAVTLTILGDGEERSALENLASALHVKEIVEFRGFVPQIECAEILKQSDALILNSVYECGGAVVLEAMSLGLPVIAADWGGPADYLDSSCGILVSPVPKESYSQRLADAIVELAKNPSLREKMGQAGFAKIQTHYDWNKKVDRILEIYTESIENHQNRA